MANQFGNNASVLRNTIMFLSLQASIGSHPFPYKKDIH